MTQWLLCQTLQCLTKQFVLHLKLTANVSSCHENFFEYINLL